MGTRSLVCVVAGGQFKVAQYGQWDGYPSGQGAKVIAFLERVFLAKMDAFRAAVDACHKISPKSVAKAMEDAGCDIVDNGVLCNEALDRFKEMNPQHSRDTGARILDYILEAGGCGLVLDQEFGCDSLFCEYAYVIDLDTDELHFYRGFNQDPDADNGHFASLPAYRPDYRDRHYERVARLGAWPLDSLPTVADMEALCADEDDDDA